MFSFERMLQVWDKYSSMYWSGLGNTLLFALAAVAVGMILGLVIASGRMMKSQSRDNEAVKWLKGVVRAVCTAYVEVLEILQDWRDAVIHGLDFDVEKAFPL